MKRMTEIILKQDISGLGYKNDLVQVKPGYARNFLIPQGYAILATPSARKVVNENMKQASHKAQKIQQQAEELASSIGELVLEIPAKAGESGKIFGAVTSLQISDALKEKGYDVDRKKISFNSEVKMLGDYSAVLDLHKEVKKEIQFKVVAD